MDRNWQSKKDEAFSSWPITFALLRKTKKGVAGCSQFKHLSIKFNHFCSGGNIANEKFAKQPLFTKRENCFWIIMILMDFNEHISLIHEIMKPFMSNSTFVKMLVLFEKN